MHCIFQKGRLTTGVKQTLLITARLVKKSAKKTILGYFEGSVVCALGNAFCTQQRRLSETQ